MAVANVGTPAYINYLLSPETPLDFHINVGNPEEVAPERIGAVKWMLIARSKVLRVMLLESKMKEKTEFPIQDIDPKTFKNFLTYMYGHDNTSALPFEDSIKLLNAAEKYDVEDLKDSLGSQIQAQVSSENVFTVLQYPEVCEQVPPLWETATEIIQYQTEDVFANNQFVDLSLEAVQFILQQDCLSVTEIEIWRAALRWAKHKGQVQDDSAGCEILRELVLPLLKHIRLCTLSMEQLNFEVFTTSILMSDEIACICMSIRDKMVIEKLTSVNKQIGIRGSSTASCYKNAGEQALLPSDGITKFWITPLCSIVLSSIVCEAVSSRNTDTTYECECEVKITRVTDWENNTSSEPPITISFTQQVRYGEDFEIPLRHNRRVILKPDNKYAFEIKFTSEHIGYSPNPKHNRFITTHFLIDYAPPTKVKEGSYCCPCSDMKMFKYLQTKNSLVLALPKVFRRRRPREALVKYD